MKLKNKKDHPLYKRFQSYVENKMWDEFQSFILRERFAIALAEIDQFDDIASEITMNIKEFANFKNVSNSDFEPATDRATLQRGKYGSIFTADILINKTHGPGMTFKSDTSGREVYVDSSFWDLECTDWADQMVRNFDEESGEVING